MDVLSRREFTALLGGSAAAILSGCRPSEVQQDLPLFDEDTDITYASATSLADAIRRRQLSSLDVVDAYLRRIEEVNPLLNAVVQLDAAGARAAAQEADEAVARGDAPGPLHGVPITIKDSLDTAGMISTGGTAGRAEHVPSEDATVVARLREAGAIVVGKTNTPELTLSFETDNAIYGRTNNPYDLERTPGGSSGGAAAIIAAGGSPLDLGSDTGGSIRLPAHFCGIVGIKPTSGRVPRTGHIVSAEGLHQAYTQIGPMARYVEDLITALPIIAGLDWRDPHVVEMPLGDPDEVSLEGLRVAFHTDNGIRTPTRETNLVVRRTANALSAAGAAVEEGRPPGLEEANEVTNRLWYPDGGAWVQRMLDAAGTGEPTREIVASFEAAESVSATELTELLEQQDRVRGRMLIFLERYDAIVCPVNAHPAPPHGAMPPESGGGASNEPEAIAAYSYTYIYNIVGWPGAVVRGGTSPDGLPIGVQVLTRPWREDVALAVARYLESELGGWQAPEL